MADSLDALLSRASPGRQASAGRRAGQPVGGSLPSGGSGSYGSASSSMGPPVARNGSIGGSTPHSTPARQGSASSSSRTLGGGSDPYATPAPPQRTDSFGSAASHSRTISGSNGGSAFGSSQSFSGTADLGSSQTIGADGVRHGRRAGSAAPKRPELGRESSGSQGPPTPSHAASSSQYSAPSPSHASMNADTPTNALRSKMRADPSPSMGGGERIPRQSSLGGAPTIASATATERPLPGANGVTGHGTIPAGAGDAPGEATAAAPRQGSATRAAPPVQCPDCGRKFKRTSFIIHQRACKRVFRTKRAAFDAQKARVTGTDAAAYVNKSNGIHTEDTESDSDDGKGGKKKRVLDEGDIASDGDEPDDEEVPRPRTAKKEVKKPAAIPGGPRVVISKKTGVASTVNAAPKQESKTKGPKGGPQPNNDADGKDGKPKWKDQSEKLRQFMKQAKNAKPAAPAPVLASKTGIDVIKISRTR